MSSIITDKYIKTDVEGLVKDPKSGAILNVDNARLEAYRKQKKAASRTRTLDERVHKLEGDIGEIKNLLRQLISKNE